MNYQPTKGANCDRENYQVKSPISVKSKFYSALNLKIQSWGKRILLSYITHYPSLFLVISNLDFNNVKKSWI